MTHITGLPDFLVIGAMKAGTTSLHHRLAAHPEIGMPGLKETDFFVPQISGNRDIAWYRAQFPTARLRGEVAPNYAKSMVFPGVPERIAAVLPNVRLIYMVRDPVARAVSEYRHKRAAGLLPDSGALDALAMARLIDPGLYHRQLGAYLPFVPLERILVVGAGELAASPAIALARVAGFLGVADHWPAAPGHDNSGTAALPGWYWALRGTAPARALRRHLPAGMGARLRRAAQRPGTVIEVPDALEEQVRVRTARDAAAFQALTGFNTQDWRL